MSTRPQSIASSPVWKIPRNGVQVIPHRTIGRLRQQNDFRPYPDADGFGELVSDRETLW